MVKLKVNISKKVNMRKTIVKLNLFFFQVKLQNNISYQMADIHHLKGKQLNYR